MELSYFTYPAVFCQCGVGTKLLLTILFPHASPQKIIILHYSLFDIFGSYCLAYQVLSFNLPRVKQRLDYFSEKFLLPASPINSCISFRLRGTEQN